MKNVVYITIFVIVITVSAMCFFGGFQTNQLTIARSLKFTSAWAEVNSAKAMKVVGPQSEILLELDITTGQSNDESQIKALMANLHLDACLVSSRSENVELRKSSLVRFNGKPFLRLSTNSGQIGALGTSFVAFRARSAAPFAVRRVIWLSYDPASRKDGVVSPND